MILTTSALFIFGIFLTPNDHTGSCVGGGHGGNACSQFAAHTPRHVTPSHPQPTHPPLTWLSQVYPTQEEAATALAELTAAARCPQ